MSTVSPRTMRTFRRVIWQPFGWCAHRTDVANKWKAKGDQAEREAVVALVELAPDLVVTDPRRHLGAGRQDDVGDLRVFPEVAVQVKFWRPASLSQGLRASAVGAAVQAINARVPLSMGLVKYPNARGEQVRWIATAVSWPVAAEARDFGSAVTRAVSWIRDDAGPQPPKPKRGAPAPRRPRKPAPPHPGRESRVAFVHGRDAEPYYLAPVEAWLAAYRELLGAQAAA